MAYEFQFKKAIVNFSQSFLIGWVVISSLLFLLAKKEGFLVAEPKFDFIDSVILSPISLSLPFLIALTIAVLRGLKTDIDNYDLNDPKQLETYIESQKLSNQPSWFKYLLTSLALSFFVLLIQPDSEVNESAYKIAQQKLEHYDSDELESFYKSIMEDRKMMESEYREFMNLSLKFAVQQTSIKTEE